MAVPVQRPRRDQLAERAAQFFASPAGARTRRRATLGAVFGRGSAVRPVGRLFALSAAAILATSFWAYAGNAPELAVPARLAPAGGAAKFYFFSPDWRPADLGELAVAMTAALSSRGVNASFQAFTRYEDFERQVAIDAPVFMVAPFWILDDALALLGARVTVLALPSRAGKSTYRKALLCRSSIDSLADLAHGTIAATLHSMGPGTSEPVLSAFHLQADYASIVPVPKDVDALLALRFGQVEAALTTGQQYDAFATSHPGEADALRVLAFSPEVPLPPLFAREDADPALRQQLGRLFAELGQAPRGADVLAMLGFDHFTPAQDISDAVKAPPASSPSQAPQPSATRAR